MYLKPIEFIRSHHKKTREEPQSSSAILDSESKHEASAAVIAKEVSRSIYDLVSIFTIFRERQRVIVA